MLNFWLGLFAPMKETYFSNIILRAYVPSYTASALKRELSFVLVCCIFDLEADSQNKWIKVFFIIE